MQSPSIRVATSQFAKAVPTPQRPVSAICLENLHSAQMSVVVNLTSCLPLSAFGHGITRFAPPEGMAIGTVPKGQDHESACDTPHDVV